jgi:hypothetical protein
MNVKLLLLLFLAVAVVTQAKARHTAVYLHQTTTVTTPSTQHK